MGGPMFSALTRFAPSFFSLDYREVPIPSIYTQAPAGGFEIFVLWVQSALERNTEQWPQLLGERRYGDDNLWVLLERPS